MDEVFEIFDCSDDDIKCKLRKKDTFYHARKIYINKSPKKVCQDGWVIDDKSLGENSANAEIFASNCGEDETNYIAKFIRIDKEQQDLDIEKIINEILIQNKVYSRFPSITIPIYQSFIERNNEYAILIMDFIPGITVGRYIEENTENIHDIAHENIDKIIKVVSHCKKLIVFLLLTGFFIHGDAHLDNFMIYNDEHNNEQIRIIDFEKGHEVLKLTNEEFAMFQKFPSIKQTQEQIINYNMSIMQKDLQLVNTSIRKLSVDEDIIEEIVKVSNDEVLLYNPRRTPPVL